MGRQKGTHYPLPTCFLIRKTPLQARIPYSTIIASSLHANPDEALERSLQVFSVFRFFRVFSVFRFFRFWFSVFQFFRPTPLATRRKAIIVSRRHTIAGQNQLSRPTEQTRRQLHTARRLAMDTLLLSATVDKNFGSDTSNGNFPHAILEPSSTLQLGLYRLWGREGATPPYHTIGTSSPHL